MPAALAGPPPAETIPPAPPRPPAGPCDADAAAAEDAQVTVTRRPGEELRLCGHHYAACELALAADGWRVTHDDRKQP